MTDKNNILLTITVIGKETVRSQQLSHPTASAVHRHVRHPHQSHMHDFWVIARQQRIRTAPADRIGEG